MFSTKTLKKVLIVAVLFVAALIVIYSFSGGSKSNADKKSDKRQTLITSLLQFEIKDQTLTEDKKKYYTEEFERLKKALEAAQTFADNRNNKQDVVNAALYWPLENFGHLYRDVGDYDKAKQAYLMTHELQPGAFLPLGDLGELYAVYYKDYPTAVGYYLEAVGIDGPYLETYYSALHNLYRFQLKDEKRAEQILIDGVKKYPKEQNILADLAFYYRQTGKTSEAISRYKELLAKFPDSVVAPQALKELEGGN